MNEVTSAAVSALTITKQVDINSSIQNVFDVLTKEVHLWWGEPYLRNFKSETLVLETKLGGKFFESWGNGGVIFGEVSEINPPHGLVLKGWIEEKKSYGLGKVPPVGTPKI